jgi:hypothetical protein
MILLTLILVIGFFILGIAGGIRYIELIVVMLLAPIVSVSAVRNYDAINVWVRETVAIVFTQAIQLLLLKIMVASMMNLEGVQKILICIAILVVILRGPQVLRTFMYASGTGNAVVGAAGAAGRMQAMKIMMKSIK